MSERTTRGPDASIEARVDAILRDMVAGDASADLRPRVMAAIASGRPRARWGAFPWPWLALAGALGAGVIAWLGPTHVPEPSPKLVRTTVGVAPVAPATPTADVPLAGAASRMATSRARAAVRVERRTSPRPAKDSSPEGSVPPLEVPPIEGTSPLVVPPIRTSSIDDPQIALPAIEIDALPEPSLSGSF